MTKRWYSHYEYTVYVVYKQNKKIGVHWNVYDDELKQKIVFHSGAL